MTADELQKLILDRAGVFEQLGVNENKMWTQGFGRTILRSAHEVRDDTPKAAGSCIECDGTNITEGRCVDCVGEVLT